MILSYISFRKTSLHMAAHGYTFGFVQTRVKLCVFRFARVQHVCFGSTHGYTWPMAPHGHTWPHMTTHGYTCKTRLFGFYTWLHMATHPHLRSPVAWRVISSLWEDGGGSMFDTSYRHVFPINHSTRISI